MKDASPGIVEGSDTNKSANSDPNDLMSPQLYAQIMDKLAEEISREGPNGYCAAAKRRLTSPFLKREEKRETIEYLCDRFNLKQSPGWWWWASSQIKKDGEENGIQFYEQAPQQEVWIEIHKAKVERQSTQTPETRDAASGTKLEEAKEELSHQQLDARGRTNTDSKRKAKAIVGRTLSPSGRITYDIRWEDGSVTKEKVDRIECFRELAEECETYEMERAIAAGDHKRLSVLSMESDSDSSDFSETRYRKSRRINSEATDMYVYETLSESLEIPQSSHNQFTIADIASNDEDDEDDADFNGDFDDQDDSDSDDESMSTESSSPGSLRYQFTIADIPSNDEDDEDDADFNGDFDDQDDSDSDDESMSTESSSPGSLRYQFTIADIPSNDEDDEDDADFNGDADDHDDSVSDDTSISTKSSSSGSLRYQFTIADIASNDEDDEDDADFNGDFDDQDDSDSDNESMLTESSSSGSSCNISMEQSSCANSATNVQSSHSIPVAVEDSRNILPVAPPSTIASRSEDNECALASSEVSSRPEPQLLNLSQKPVSNEYTFGDDDDDDDESDSDYVEGNEPDSEDDDSTSDSDSSTTSDSGDSESDSDFDAAMAGKNGKLLRPAIS
ncbi:uncharacterized protein VTP21DRAFT_8806 [Calcarisporiella thermophila]|uniref:uncharacterized protein n=1 Tax=Calcarisporiella thermophila TaxID=911321 RepID=UPI00374405DB